MNKAQIRDQILALLNRNDCSVEQANIFIDQAVARIQRTLRVPSMEKQSLSTVNDITPELIVLPDDFLNIKYFYTSDGMLEYRDVTTFLSIPNSVGMTKYYTRLQGGLQLKPVPVEGTEFTLVYYGEIPDLVNDTDTNFITIIASDLLIYCALTFAADFFVDDRKVLFEERYSVIYREVDEQARLTEMEQTSMAIQPLYPVIY